MLDVNDQPIAKLSEDNSGLPEAWSTAGPHPPALSGSAVPFAKKKNGGGPKPPPQSSRTVVGSAFDRDSNQTRGSRGLLKARHLGP